MNSCCLLAYCFCFTNSLHSYKVHVLILEKMLLAFERYCLASADNQKSPSQNAPMPKCLHDSCALSFSGQRRYSNSSSFPLFQGNIVCYILHFYYTCSMLKNVLFFKSFFSHSSHITYTSNSLTGKSIFI